MSNHVVDKVEFKKFHKRGWMTPLGAAKRWGCSEQTVYALLKKGKLIAKKTVDGRHYLIDPTQPRPY